MSGRDDARLPDACSRLRDQLDALAADHLSEDERGWVEQHLLECETCFHAWFDHLGMAGEVPVLEDAARPVTGQADLEEVILRRLGVDPCAGALDRLEAAGPADVALDRALLEQHLQRCPTCSAIAAALHRLEVELPRLCELEPDAAFTADVLRATVEARPLIRRRSPRQLLAGLKRWWGNALSRPRFAMEAAYAVSLLLFTLTGADHAVLRVLEKDSGAPAQVTATLAHLTSELDHRADGVGADLFRVVDSSVERSSNVVRNALDTLTTIWARSPRPAAGDGATAQGQTDRAAADQETPESRGWLPRLLGIRPARSTGVSRGQPQQPTDSEPGPHRAGDGSPHQGGSR